MIVIGPLLQVLIEVLRIYIYVVIGSVILSWLVAFDVVNMRNRFVYSVGSILNRLTEPALRPIRRFLPNLGGLDLSPRALIFIIWFLQQVLFRILINLERGAF